MIRSQSYAHLNVSSVFCFSFSCFLYARLISLYKLYLNVTQRATSLTSSSCSGSLPYFHLLMFDVLLCILSLWRIYDDDDDDDDDDNEYTAEYPWMRSWWVRCGRGCPFSAREVLGKGQCLFPNFFFYICYLKWRVLVQSAWGDFVSERLILSDYVRKWVLHAVYIFLTSRL